MSTHMLLSTMLVRNSILVEAELKLDKEEIHTKVCNGLVFYPFYLLEGALSLFCTSQHTNIECIVRKRVHICHELSYFVGKAQLKDKPRNETLHKID